MQEIIQLIRQQLVLCLRILELSSQQREALIHTAAPAVQRLTKEMEIVIMDLNRQERKRREFLTAQGASTVAEWLENQPAGLERDMAQQLLAKEAAVLERLKTASANNQQHLNNNMKYISYNINVLTGAVAGVTYGAAEAGGMATVPGTKMFEANI